MLTERRRTVRKQYEALQQRRALQDTTNHHHGNTSLTDTSNPQSDATASVLVLPSRFCPALHLDSAQKLQLQQQIQQVCVRAAVYTYETMTPDLRSAVGTFTRGTSVIDGEPVH